MDIMISHISYSARLEAIVLLPVLDVAHGPQHHIEPGGGHPVEAPEGAAEDGEEEDAEGEDGDADQEQHGDQGRRQLLPLLSS